MILEPATDDPEDPGRSSRSNQEASLFTPDQPQSTTPTLPAVELTTENKTTDPRPHLEFFDDQCGCN